MCGVADKKRDAKERGNEMNEKRGMGRFSREEKREKKQMKRKRTESCTLMLSMKLFPNWDINNSTISTLPLVFIFILYSFYPFKRTIFLVLLLLFRKQMQNWWRDGFCGLYCLIFLFFFIQWIVNQTPHHLITNS